MMWRELVHKMYTIHFRLENFSSSYIHRQNWTEWLSHIKWLANCISAFTNYSLYLMNDLLCNLIRRPQSLSGAHIMIHPPQHRKRGQAPEYKRAKKAIESSAQYTRSNSCLYTYCSSLGFQNPSMLCKTYQFRNLSRNSAAAIMMWLLVFWVSKFL